MSVGYQSKVMLLDQHINFFINYKVPSDCTKKAQMIVALRICFQQKPHDLDLDEEDSADEDEA